MSHKASAWAIEQKPKSKLEKLVLIVIADCHNGASGACFPSMTYIAEHSLCTRRGAMAAVESLEKQGFISVVRRHGESNNYRLHLDRHLPPPSDTAGGEVSSPDEPEGDPPDSSQTGEVGSLVKSVHQRSEFTSTGEVHDKTGEVHAPTGEVSSPEPGSNLEDNLELNQEVRAREPVDDVIDHLNRVTSSAFETDFESLQLINARLASGMTVDDLKLICDFKAAEWLGDSKMSQYLRPTTLFHPSKAPGYLGAAKRASQNPGVSATTQQNLDNLQGVLT